MTAFLSEAVAQSRLLRPYGLRRLEKALWHVETAANGITQRRLRLMTDPVVDPHEWVWELERLQNDLAILSDEQCPAAWSRLDLLVRSAPGDYERAVAAMRAMLVGSAS